MYFYKVAVPVPYLDFLTYKSNETISAGSLVLVEVGKKVLRGIVFGEDKEHPKDIKEIISVLSSEVVFKKEYLNFIEKLSNYYCYPLGTVVYKLIPLKLFDEDLSVELGEGNNIEPFELNNEQEKVFRDIFGKIDRFSVNLIYGVTGSGKTEVYCRLINEVVSNDGQVLYIVPEIALTSQLYQRLRKRISGRLGVYHSKVAPKKRIEVFNLFAKNKIDVVLGTRSSLFLPAYNLKLIVVDEEHEMSFKQEDLPQYQLRDMAVLYGKCWNIPVVLGSATPSVESMYNCMSGKYQLYRLNNKFYNDHPVDIELLDMKNTDLIEGSISKQLYDAIYERLQANEQVLLLVNKKGYSNHLRCVKCGTILQCTNCSVSVTYYKSLKSCKCHYCNEVFRYFTCTKCGSNDFLPTGTGSEKVYEILDQLFPDEVLRLDHDIVTSVKRVDQIFNAFERKEKRILVGTNIIAKGLDYPDITLIGVVNIDNMFVLPDFRAEERVFQTLVQFIGRGGRFDKKCKMLIQTYSPENPVFAYVMGGDHDRFYGDLLNKRKQLGYPPFTRLVRVLLTGANHDLCHNLIEKMADELKKNLQKDDRILGPSVANIMRIKNRFRYHFLIKVKNTGSIPGYKKAVEGTFNKLKKGNMTLLYDVDPYNFM